MSSRPRISAPATVIALLALTISAGGTAWAAGALPRGSVGTAQLKRNAVTSAKVTNGSLRAADFRAGDLPRGASGVAGATGPRGPQGVKGDRGADAAKLWAVVDGDGTMVRSSRPGITAVAAPNGIGDYTVELGQDVSACAWMVSVDGAVRQWIVKPGLTATQVAVDLRLSDGSDALNATNARFHLAVLC